MSPKRVCAWCGSLLSEGSEPASHGICEPCSDAMHDRLVGRCDAVFSGSRCTRAQGHDGPHQSVYSSNAFNPVGIAWPSHLGYGAELIDL